MVESVEAIAKARNTEPAQVALAWVLQKLPGAAPILGATRVEHVDAAVASLSLKLEPSEMARLEAGYALPSRAGH